LISHLCRGTIRGRPVDGGGGAGAGFSLHGPERSGYRHARGGDEALAWQVAQAPASRTDAQALREREPRQDEPSGSQDMVGLIYPGISRLDYDSRLTEECFRRTSNRSTIRARLAGWSGSPRAARGAPAWRLQSTRRENLDRQWVARLGQTERIASRRSGTDLLALGVSLNECMTCWEKLCRIPCGIRP